MMTFNSSGAWALSAIWLFSLDHPVGGVICLIAALICADFNE